MGKMRKLAKSFWHGVLDAMGFAAATVMALACMALVLLLAVFMAAGAVEIVSYCGVWSLLFYVVDIAIMVILCKELFHSNLKGSWFYRLAKGIGIVIMCFLFLMFINVILWTLGNILLLPFGVCLTIGSTMLVGLGFVAVVGLLLLLVIYIRDCGWYKTAELLIRILGILIVVGLIGLLIFWLI